MKSKLELTETIQETEELVIISRRCSYQEKLVKQFHHQQSRLVVEVGKVVESKDERENLKTKITESMLRCDGMNRVYYAFY